MEPDLTIIGELLEAIERDPSAVEGRKLLAEQYEAYGWLDAAKEQWSAVIQSWPNDSDAKVWFAMLAINDTPKAKLSGADRFLPRPQQSVPIIERVSSRQLEAECRSLIAEAHDLVQDLQIYQEMFPGNDLTGDIADLKAVAAGRSKFVFKVKPPASARVIATKLKAEDQPVDFVFADLESYARWLRNQPNTSGDDLRDAVRKRAYAITEALPTALLHVPAQAFMHMEHEVLGKGYRNEGGRTMLLEPVASIPRRSFWSSEDGYAWDMEELAEALKSNKGSMRNPLSGAMFTADDVRAIVQHPLCKGLAALQLKQQDLTNGMRKDTITRLAQISSTLLADQSADAEASRKAVDEFLSYVATLPEEEQSALRELQVPARDSHTGQAFDGSISSAIDDAKANRQCFHKTGDFLGQAARHLERQARGKGHARRLLVAELTKYVSSGPNFDHTGCRSGIS